MEEKKGFLPCTPFDELTAEEAERFTTIANQVMSCIEMVEKVRKQGGKMSLVLEFADGNNSFVQPEQRPELVATLVEDTAKTLTRWIQFNVCKICKERVPAATRREREEKQASLSMDELANVLTEGLTDSLQKHSNSIPSAAEILNIPEIKKILDGVMGVIMPKTDPGESNSN